MITEQRETRWKTLGDGCESREISGFYSNGKEAYKITQCIIYQGRHDWSESWYAKNMFGGPLSPVTFGKLFDSKEEARFAQEMVAQAYATMWSHLLDKAEGKTHGR